MIYVHLKLMICVYIKQLIDIHIKQLIHANLSSSSADLRSSQKDSVCSHQASDQCSHQTADPNVRIKQLDPSLSSRSADLRNIPKKLFTFASDSWSMFVSNTLSSLDISFARCACGQDANRGPVDPVSRSSTPPPSPNLLMRTYVTY